MIKCQPKPSERDNGFGKVVAAAVVLAFVGGAGGYYILGDVPIAEAAAKLAKPLTSYGRYSGSVRRELARHSLGAY